MGNIFKEHGALTVVDCWGDDVPQGKLTSMPMAVRAEEGEVVCFSWITWASKEAHATGMGKAMEDPRMRGNAMPFDGRRIIFGGFEMVSSL